MCLFVCLSACLFVCLSVCLFVCLSVCLFVCLFACVCLICLFLCACVRAWAGGRVGGWVFVFVCVASCFCWFVCLVACLFTCLLARLFPLLLVCCCLFRTSQSYPMLSHGSRILKCMARLAQKAGHRRLSTPGKARGLPSKRFCAFGDACCRRSNGD